MVVLLSIGFNVGGGGEWGRKKEHSAWFVPHPVDLK